MLQILQEQVNKQTRMLKLLLEVWKSQEERNKKTQAEMQAEIRAIRDELLMVKDELYEVKQ